MIRNKSTIQLITRLLMAVFLFVIISPISVYASGDSASDNDSDEEYESWSDALQDSDYTDNLAEMVTQYWLSSWLSYVGTGAEVVEDVSEFMGDQYDRTVSLYDNLYDYILPYSKETVIQLNPSDFSIQDYGKPIRNKNNLKVLHEISKDLGTDLDTQLSDDFFTDYPSKVKNKGDLIHFDFMPAYMYVKLSPISISFSTKSEYNTAYPAWCYSYTCYFRERLWDPQITIVHMWNDSYYPVFIINNSDLSALFDVSWGNISKDYTSTSRVWDGTNYRNDSTFGHSTERTLSNNIYPFDVHSIQMNMPRYFYIHGNAYIYSYLQEKLYFWDGTDLFEVGSFSANSIHTVIQYLTDNHNNISFDNKVSYTKNVTIINTVNFDEYQDLIDQLILDVNISSTITNSLLLELLNEVRNQPNIYVQQDGDDIYDYLDYLINKLNEVKDIHIEIPDLTPDVSGIVDGITALLNFLASIIRAIGSIVSSLLEGLFHLFVPTESDWNDINIQFESLSAPLSWIKEFISEAASNISLLLFGRNVTDFETVETEDVDLVMGEGGVDPDIIYDPNSGAPKIPVRFSNSSSEIFSNIEDCYIIDLSWYAPYKPVGDIIVVAFCWIFFIWRVLHGLPGIINGATGSEDIHDDVQNKINEMYLR